MRYYGPIGLNPASSPSMLKALSCLPKTPGSILPLHLHLAQLPVTVTQPSGRHRIIVRKSWLDHTKSCPSILAFVISTVVPYVIPEPGLYIKEKGVIAREDVFCKVVDLFQRQDPIDALDKEVRNYATLKDLQGVVVPRVRGYYDVWGLLRLLALEKSYSLSHSLGGICPRSYRTMQFLHEGKCGIPG